jgi:anaerobic selenocysteine-containing dehydrogenase
MADIWVPLRAGSDILFLGGLINCVLENNKKFREYVVHYTNTATILRDDFRDTEDLEGYFSGWNATAVATRVADSLLRCQKQAACYNAVVLNRHLPAP